MIPEVTPGSSVHFQGCHRFKNERGWQFNFSKSDGFTVFLRPLQYVFFAAAVVLAAVLRAQTPGLPAALPEDVLPGLRDILHTAMQQSPEMISHNLDLAEQEANRYQQAAQEWPGVSGNFNYAFNKSFVASNASAATSNSGFVFGVNLYQPIYHWGTIKARIDIAHLQIKISQRRYADAYRELATSLRTQYLSLIAQKVQLRNARFSLGQTKTAVAVVDDRFKNKTATADEVTNAHLQLEDVQLSIDRAVEGFEYAKRMLELTAGLSDLSDDAVPEEIPPPPSYSAESTTGLLRDFARDGLDHTFQAQIYDYKIKQSELKYKIAKYRLYPMFDFGLGANEQNQTNATTSSISQTSVLTGNVGVGANWSIFDGFATRGAKLEALTDKRQAERDRDTYRDQTLEQARYLDQQVEFSARALAIAEKRFELSRDGLQRAKDNFKLHTISQADMDQATAGFYQAQAAIFSARADFFSQWSEYLSLLGIDPVLNNLPPSLTNHAN